MLWGIIMSATMEVFMPTFTVIGSHAMRFHFSDFNRKPADLDMFSDMPKDALESLFPGHRIDSIWHDGLERFLRGGWATVEQLYTIKISHAFWDIHGTWDKHMGDILFLQSKGAGFDRDLYDFLFPIHKEMHGRKITNLNQSKDAFFKDAVVRKYDHDSLHDSVAYGDEPMYTRILKDGSDVMVDNDKFWAMSLDDKYKTIREEVYATALERYVVPSEYRISPRRAYHMAMKKSITSLFKGEWALFIVQNYTQLWQPDMDYVKHHKSKSHKLILL